MRNFTVRHLTMGAVLAAVYAALTLFLPIPQYGPVQIRFAEALMVLPCLFPWATPGLVVGCVIANLNSPYALDVVFGSAATLLGCLWTARITNLRLAALPPVVCNAVIVGGEIALLQTGMSGGFWQAFAWNALSVGAGQAVACGLLGSLLLGVVSRTPTLRAMIPAQRQDRLW